MPLGLIVRPLNSGVRQSQPMRSVPIAEVSVDAAGSLRVRPRLPSGHDFSQIHRAAFSARWDRSTRTIFAETGSRLSHAGAFNCILVSAAYEYDCLLSLSWLTKWTGVSPTLRGELKSIATEVKKRLAATIAQKAHGDAKADMLMAGYTGQTRDLARMRELFRAGRYLEVVAAYERLPLPHLLTKAQLRLVDIARKHAA
jgi:hypothetical protein